MAADRQQAMAAALFESVETDVSSRTLRMTNFPAGWTTLSEEAFTSKIRSLLQTLGALESPPSALRTASGQLVATATFKSQQMAEKAVKTLHGVDNRTEAEKRRMGYTEARDVDRFAVYLLAKGAAGNPLQPDEEYDPEAGPATDEELTLLCIDEARLLSEPPSNESREIFLRDMPIEDYTEPQLRDWLRGFGQPEEIHFFKDPSTRKLNAKGYVRFASHEEAAGLLAAFPADESDDEEGPGVQGSWSLSERFLQNHLSFLDALQRHLDQLATTCRYSRILLVGGGRLPPAGRGLELSAHGPLCIIAYSKADSESMDKLKEKLTELLEDALTNPSNFCEAVGEAGAAAPPTEPCILVRGFPASWREQQVRLVFALFGGIGSVRFASSTGERVAYVELKNKENMPKAVEQLHNTKVGDGELIEECVVSCELFGDSEFSDGRAARRTIFLDELRKPKRPELKADPEDREVFMTGLPIKDFTEDKLQEWLAGFGALEEVFLLRDADRRLNAKGYVRFQTHRDAENCISAQASEQDAEEGDVVAWWSESERALRSAYGPNLHSALASNDGRVFSSLLESCEVREVWMQSKLWRSKDPAAPPLQGKQVHFVSTCTAQQRDEIQEALSIAMQAFHDRGRGEDGRGGSSSSRQADAKPAWSTPGQSWSLSAVPPARPPAPWGYNDPYAMRPPGPWAPPWRGPMPPPPGFGGPPLPPPGTPPPPGAPPAPAEKKRSRSRRRARRKEKGRQKEDIDPASAMAEVTNDPEVQRLVYEGEALIKEGKELCQQGDRARAYDKFYAGLQYLLKVMPALGEGADSKPALALKAKIHGYLDETEKLKAELDSGEASKAPDSHMPALEDDVEGCLGRGEDLIVAGQRLAERGKLGQAYESYCEGIQLLLKVMPRLSEDDPRAGPRVARLRGKISKYLEEAESVKEQRDEQNRHDNGRDRGRSRNYRKGDRPPSHGPGSPAGSRRNGRRSRSGRRFELRTAAEVEDEGRRSRGREDSPPRHSQAAAGFQERNGRERQRSRRKSNRERRSPPREASRSRTWTQEKAPCWEETLCRPKSAAKPGSASLSAAPPLLRPKSAAKPPKR